MASRFFEHGWGRGLWLIIALLAVAPVIDADEVILAQEADEAKLAQAAALPLEPVYRVKGLEGHQWLSPGRQLKLEKLQARSDGVTFYAIVSNDWPTGLVPIFSVEKTNRFELRRHPPRGQENSYEPIFFALAPANEPEATNVAGRWECQAIRGEGSKVHLAWELAVEGEIVSGRFDQNTEYRFASITEGTFRTNRLELRVEHVMDAYVLAGELRAGTLKGLWRRIDECERGTWEARRVKRELKIPADMEIVSLYEWRRASDDARRYAVDGETMEPVWTRTRDPLCQVWRTDARK